MHPTGDPPAQHLAVVHHDRERLAAALAGEHEPPGRQLGRGERDRAVELPVVGTAAHRDAAALALQAPRGARERPLPVLPAYVQVHDAGLEVDEAGRGQRPAGAAHRGFEGLELELARAEAGDGASRQRRPGRPLSGDRRRVEPLDVRLDPRRQATGPAQAPLRPRGHGGTLELELRDLDAVRIAAAAQREFVRLEHGRRHAAPALQRVTGWATAGCQRDVCQGDCRLRPGERPGEPRTARFERPPGLVEQAGELALDGELRLSAPQRDIEALEAAGRLRLDRERHAVAADLEAAPDVERRVRGERPRQRQHGRSLDRRERRLEREPRQADAFVPAPGERCAVDREQHVTRRVDELEVFEHEIADEELERQREAFRRKRTVRAGRCGRRHERDPDLPGFQHFDGERGREQLGLDRDDESRGLHLGPGTRILEAGDPEAAREGSFHRRHRKAAGDEAARALESPGGARVRVQHPARERDRRRDHDEQRQDEGRCEYPGGAQHHRSGVPMLKWMRQGRPSTSSARAKSSRMGPATEYQRTPTPAPWRSSKSLHSLNALPMS